MVITLKRYSWSLHFVTIALCSYLVSQAVSNFIASRLEMISEGVPAVAEKGPETVAQDQMGEGGEEAQDFQVILDRNIFNSQDTGGSLEAGALQDPMIALAEGEAVKTSLDVRLLGTLVVGEGTDRRSSATVAEGKGGKASVYFVGDEKSFSGNVRLTKVTTGRIEFVNNGRLEFAEIDRETKKSIFASAQEVFGDAKKTAASGEKPPTSSGSAETSLIVVDQAEIDDALSNLDRFYTEVRIVPHFQAGKVMGMKVLSVKPGSLINKLGIRRGDVLQKINGQELDVKRGIALFNELKSQRSFTIDLTRGGENKTLEYEIR